MPTDILSSIADFLTSQNIALVGVSRQPANYSRMVMREMLQRGFHLHPVNPYAQEIEELPCVASVNQITPAPEAALLVAPASESLTLLRECAAAGVRRIWIRHALRSPEREEARELCAKLGISLIEGECPLMHLKNPGFIHRFHRFIHVNLGRLH